MILANNNSKENQHIQILSGLSLGEERLQTERSRRHDSADGDQRGRHSGKPQEAFHGRLDIHVYRARTDFGQPFQANEVFHAERSGHVSGSGECYGRLRDS